MALLAAGHFIDSYWLSEIDRDARSIGDHIIQRLKREHADQLHPLFDNSSGTLPNDITLITEQMIIDMGRIDLFSSAWPCTDLSGASREEAQGLDGDRSALFFKTEEILAWVRKYNPHCHFFCENVVFSEKFPNAWNLVNHPLGDPVVWDAALISYSHRLRAYWTSFFTQEDVPDLDMGIKLKDVLHADHIPRRAMYTDVHPWAGCNTRGLPMTRYVTVVRAYETHSIREGPGLVLDRELGLQVRPYVEEVERILGYEVGDTLSPDLQEMPKWQSDRIRLAVLGNVIDVRVLTHIFSFLPNQPSFV
jgi:hypothetical protein